jgi:hypothetical protein
MAVPCEQIGKIAQLEERVAHTIQALEKLSKALDDMSKAFNSLKICVIILIAVQILSNPHILTMLRAVGAVKGVGL